jgi:predicted transcriptional regulator
VVKFPSYARIYIDDVVVKEVFLPDDPADHRGVLSWFSQPQDGRLREAGSYGFLVTSIIPQALLKSILTDKKCTLRIEVPDILPGGVAIYGKDFGRYPLDPTFVFQFKE